MILMMMITTIMEMRRKRFTLPDKILLCDVGQQENGGERGLRWGKLDERWVRDLSQKGEKEESDHNDEVLWLFSAASFFLSSVQMVIYLSV